MAGEADKPNEFIGIAGGVIALGKPYATNVNLVFRVSRWKDGNQLEGYRILLGPKPGSEGPVHFTIRDEASLLVPGGTNLQLQLTGGSGFAYMAGVQPYGGTDGGSSTSEGTIMLVQRAKVAGSADPPADAYHRFFRLRGTEIVKVRASSGAEKEIAADGWYVEIDTNDAIADPKPIESDDIATFVAAVISLAEAGGLPTPAGESD